MPRNFIFNYSPKTKPYSHQSEAIEYIQRKEYIALFDEQGLGKTKIVLEALCNNIREGMLDGGLIICRKNLIQNWLEEIETHTYLKSIVLRGSTKEKGIRFMGFTHFYIINYESVIGEIERLKMFLKTRKMAIVLDESHAIKNPNSKTTLAVLQLASLSKKRVIVSGTPVANKPEDLWSQFFFLDEGHLLGKDYKSFKTQFSIDLREQSTFVDNSKFSLLRKLIDENSIRRKKNEVLELPEKVYIDKLVVLNGKQLSMYNQLRDELFLEIKNIEGEIIIDKSEDILKKLLRLEQVASNPKLVDQSYEEIPAKFPCIHKLIEEITCRKEKVIIWSCFVDNIRQLKQELYKYGPEIIYGNIPIEKRSSIIRRFKTDPDCKVLIANPAAAKEGLTLTIANNAIYLDRNFNLVDYLQSQDRIHRISQTKKCNIIKLVAKDTIDEYIDEILRRKHYLAGFVQGDEEKIGFSEKLTKGDFLNFLGSF